MKKITTLMCAVALWCSAQAQAPALHFGRDGKFRIAQFTDVHLDLGTPYRRAQAEKTIAQMRYILDAEHPDLVAGYYKGKVNLAKALMGAAMGLSGGKANPALLQRLMDEALEKGREAGK